MQNNCRISVVVLSMFLLISPLAYAWDETITVAAEKPEGVVLSLSAGTYLAEIAGGAISLFLPIHPQYQWLYGLAVGTDVEGGQETANIGTLYFEPADEVFTQAEAEKEALEATAWKQPGTYLQFSLEQAKQVRFWVSDFDYSDNSGSERVRIYRVK